MNFALLRSASALSTGLRQSPAPRSHTEERGHFAKPKHPTGTGKAGRRERKKIYDQAGLVPPQRPFRVCCNRRETKKGITAGTLMELKERVCQALLLTISAASVYLVCEEDGTEVETDEFLMTLPDNTVLMALEPGQTWKPQAGSVVLRNQDKPRTGRDIARVTFDLYKISPKDVFGSLSVKATFQGLYSVSADFQCLGPKKVLREVLRVASTLLQAVGHLLITSASMIRRIIEGTELWQTQRTEYTASWH